jgi:hypothetical protein
MDGGGIVGFGALGLAVLWLACRAVVKAWTVPSAPLAEYGDVIELPAAARNAGGRAKRGDRLARNGDIARHRDGPVTP